MRSESIIALGLLVLGASAATLDLRQDIEGEPSPCMGVHTGKTCMTPGNNRCSYECNKLVSPHSLILTNREQDHNVENELGALTIEQLVCGGNKVWELSEVCQKGPTCHNPPGKGGPTCGPE